MEAGALAPACVPGFELRGGVGVFDDVVDAGADAILTWVVEGVEGAEVLWDFVRGEAERGAGAAEEEGGEGGHLCPAVVDHVGGRFGGGVGYMGVEVGDAL